MSTMTSSAVDVPLKIRLCVRMVIFLIGDFDIKVMLNS